MPHPSTPATDRARALLLEKQTYGDVTAATGLSRQQVGAIASRLRMQGYELLDWTPEQKRRRLISIMPKGSGRHTVRTVGRGTESTVGTLFGELGRRHSKGNPRP